MPDNKKLTDNEIIKAWNEEIHLANYVNENYRNGIKVSLIENTLDLINRLQTEKEDLKTQFRYLDIECERLEAENERLQAQINEMFDTLDYRAKKILELEDNLKTAKAENSKLEVKISEVEYDFSLLKQEREVVKAEAYKECIEKVKEDIDTHEHLTCEQCNCVPIGKSTLDNLLNELVGDNNG